METMESLTDEKIKEIAEKDVRLLAEVTAWDNFIELLKDSDSYEELRYMVDKMKRDAVSIILWHYVSL